MIEYCKDPNQYLYHYTKADTVLNHILPSMRLRLSRYTGTNDPKETKTWSFNCGSNEGRDITFDAMEKLSLWLSDELKSQTRVLCFSTDRGPMTGDHIADIFMRGFCKPRMWSHYANDHKGMCLVLDRKMLLEDFRAEHLDKLLFEAGPVTYADRSIISNLMRDQQYTINLDSLERYGRDSYPQLHIQKHISRLFFEKMTDWRDEAEWRFVVFAKSADNIYVSLRRALVGIVFGDQTKQDDIYKVINSIEGSTIQIQGLKWKNCSPWYDYHGLSEWQMHSVRKGMRT